MTSLEYMYCLFWQVGAKASGTEKDATAKTMPGTAKEDDKKAENAENAEAKADHDLHTQIKKDPERAKKIVGPLISSCDYYTRVPAKLKARCISAALAYFSSSNPSPCIFCTNQSSVLSDLDHLFTLNIPGLTTVPQ